MLAYAIDNPAPSTIVLISGDRDFAYALSILRLRRYQVVLVTLPTAHPSLTSQASTRFDWLNDILDIQKPPLGTNNPESHLERSRAASFREKPWEISHRSPFRPNVPSHTVGQVDFDDHNEEFSYLLQCSPKMEQPKPPLLSAPIGLESIRNTQKYVGPSSQNHQSPNSSPSNNRSAPLNDKFQSPLTNGSITAVGTPDPRDPLLSAEDFVSSNIRPADNSTIKSQTDNSASLLQEEFRSPLLSPSMRTASVPSPPISDDVALTLTAPASHPLGPNSAMVDAAALPSTSTEQVHPDRASTTISTTAAAGVPPMFIVLVNILQAFRLKGDLRPRRSLVGEKLSNKVFHAAGVKKFSQYSALAEQKGIVQLGGQSGNAWIALNPPFHNTSCT